MINGQRKRGPGCGPVRAFETKWPNRPDDLAALADFPGLWDRQGAYAATAEDRRQPAWSSHLAQTSQTRQLNFCAALAGIEKLARLASCPR
jgi:hypothetical protein